MTRVLGFILPHHTSFTHDSQRVQLAVHIRRAVDKRGADADTGHNRHSHKHRKTHTHKDIQDHFFTEMKSRTKAAVNITRAVDKRGEGEVDIRLQLKICTQRQILTHTQDG